MADFGLCDASLNWVAGTGCMRVLVQYQHGYTCALCHEPLDRGDVVAWVYTRPKGKQLECLKMHLDCLPELALSRHSAYYTSILDAMLRLGIKLGTPMASPVEENTMAEQAKLSYAELLALYDQQEAERKRLAAENAALKAAPAVRQNTVSFRCRGVGERYQDSTGKEQLGKGTLSMYGVGRFPVSLYASQWRTLIKAVKNGDVEKALEENKAKLSERE